MQTLPHPDDVDAAFGERAAPPALARDLRPDERALDRWARHAAKVNASRTAPLRFASPIDMVPATLAARTAPRLAWPAEWGDLARRCRSYPGDLVGIIGGPGSGKTQFGIQLARAIVAAERGCVLWSPLELTPTDINLRIAANLARRHVSEVRERWPEQQLTAAVATVTDRWRYVDRAETLVDQLEIYRIFVDAAAQIYQAPPVLVIDYLQILALMAHGQEERGAAARAIEALRLLAETSGCWIVLISQPSRSNTPALAGKVEIEAATDLIGVGAESSQLERAAAVQIALNVFKADDAAELDAHWNITKARHTGAEGRTGARYCKEGGVWIELDHLPATPIEVKAEVKRRKRRKADDGAGEATPRAAREDLNGSRAELAASSRRVALLEALRAAGDRGLGGRDVRRVKGSGSAHRAHATLVELAAAGRVAQDSGRWYLLK